jgi:hypothetical protein
MYRLHAIDQYAPQDEKLRQECVFYIYNSCLSIDNIVSIYKHATEHQFNELIDVCKIYIILNKSKLENITLPQISYSDILNQLQGSTRIHYDVDLSKPYDYIPHKLEKPKIVCWLLLFINIKVLYGSYRIGKSCLYFAMRDKQIPERYLPTIGLEYVAIEYIHENSKLMFQLWDTGMTYVT